MPPYNQTGSEVTASTESVASISSLLALCIQAFHSLLEFLRSHESCTEPLLTLEDELGRLRVWAGNHGTHRKQTDRLSLDHRLREAPEIHRDLRVHLDDITEAIRNLIAIISKSRKPLEQEDASSSESDDPEYAEFRAQIKAERKAYSEFEELLLDINHTITSLYKFSITIQNSAHRDRTEKASQIDLHHFEPYDIQHASDKFGRLRDDKLIQHLGKANTRRRQLLAYHKDHSNKISKYIDVALIKAISIPQVQGVQEEEIGPGTISTKWTQDTTVSTIRPENLELESNSGRTVFSATTSTANYQSRQTISIPPPPNPESAAQNVPFTCPYCCLTVELENVGDDWRHHVYSDLRPYICTFGGCVKAGQLYGSYTEWSEHERYFHRREWPCNLCSYTCQSSSLLESHLQDNHAGIIPNNQLRVVARVSERPISSAQQCPLCSKLPISDPSHFQQHLARHLQQLALFVLPRPVDKDSDPKDHDKEANESQQALMADDKTEDEDVLEDNDSNQHDMLTMHEEEFASDDEDIAIENPSTINSSTARNSAIWNEDDLKSQQTAGFLSHLAEANYIGTEINQKARTENPDTPTKFNNLGSVLFQQGKYEEAETMHWRALEEGYKLKFGPDHPDILSSVSQLGSVLASQGKYKEAESMHQQASDAYELIFGPEHPTTLISINNLSSVLSSQGKYGEAESMLQKALRGRVRVLGPKHPDTLTNISDLGLVFYQWVKLEQAGTMHQYALRGREKMLGPEHPLTLASISKLGSVLDQQGKYKEVESMHQQALRGRERVLGPEHSDTLPSVSDLGFVLAHQGKYKEAESMLQQALRGRVRILGPEHPDTLTSIDNLSSVLSSQGKHDEALSIRHSAT